MWLDFHIFVDMNTTQLEIWKNIILNHFFLISLPVIIDIITYSVSNKLIHCLATA